MLIFQVTITINTVRICELVLKSRKANKKKDKMPEEENLNENVNDGLHWVFQWNKINQNNHKRWNQWSKEAIWVEIWKRCIWESFIKLCFFSYHSICDKWNRNKKWFFFICLFLLILNESTLTEVIITSIMFFLFKNPYLNVA